MKTIKELEAEILNNQHKMGDISASLDQRDTKWKNIKKLEIQLRALKDVLKLLKSGKDIKKIIKEIER